MATDWRATQPGLIGAQPIADNSTTQKHELGAIIQATDLGGDSSPRGAGEFIYLQGLASVAVGEVCIYDSDTFIVKLAVANDIGPIAVAMAATVVNEYGWFQIQGKGSALAAASFADDGDCYLTATAGTMDDADVAGDYITGMKGASAVAGGVADVELARPNVTNSVDN
jgi:hypothetical protein